MTRVTVSRVPGTSAIVPWLKLTHDAGMPETDSRTRSTTRPRLWMTAVANTVPPGSTGVAGETIDTRIALDGASSNSAGPPSPSVSCSAATGGGGM